MAKKMRMAYFWKRADGTWEQVAPQRYERILRLATKNQGSARLARIMIDPKAKPKAKKLKLAMVITLNYCYRLVPCKVDIVHNFYVATGGWLFQAPRTDTGKQRIQEWAEEHRYKIVTKGF